MPGASSRTQARTSSSARRAPSAHRSFSRRSCTTNASSAFDALAHHLGEAVIGIYAPELRQFLIRLGVPATAAQFGDALEPRLRLFSCDWPRSARRGDRRGCILLRERLFAA